MELVARDQTDGMRLREADAADDAMLAEFMLGTPIESETAFVMDRTPRFSALPDLRGRSRTFIVEEDRRTSGIATALWRTAWDGGEQVVVGELLDVRIAEWARGGRTAYVLISAVCEALRAEGARHLFCLIGRHNQAAIVLTGGRAGLPQVRPLASFASANLIAFGLPRLIFRGGPLVRPANEADAALIGEFLARQTACERFAPTDPMPWPDPSGRTRAWLAFADDGSPAGALIAWDGEDVRRIRVTRYRRQDTALRTAVSLAFPFGLAAPLPRPGGVLSIWATQLLAMGQGGGRTLHKLVAAALKSCAHNAGNILQINLQAEDPALRQLARYPRSTFQTTLYGGALVPGGEITTHAGESFYNDIARA